MSLQGSLNIHRQYRYQLHLIPEAVLFKLQIETRPELAVVLDTAENSRQEFFQKPFQVFEKLVGARGFEPPTTCTPYRLVAHKILYLLM